MSTTSLALMARVMNIDSVADFRRAMRHGPYAWPGGYPVYFAVDDGEAIAFTTVRNDKWVRRQMLEALRDGASDGWRPVALEVNYEDADLYCAHTGSRIESAYGEDAMRRLTVIRAWRGVCEGDGLPGGSNRG